MATPTRKTVITESTPEQPSTELQADMDRQKAEETAFFEKRRLRNSKK
jgi:hypothetical protein